MRTIAGRLVVRSSGQSLGRRQTHVRLIREENRLYCPATQLRSPSKQNGQGMRHAHRRERIHLGGYASEQRFFGELDKLNSLFTANRRKPIQKLFERSVSLDVIDQGLHGNTSTAKTRSPAHAAGIGPHNLIQSRLLFRRHNFTLHHREPFMLITAKSDTTSSPGSPLPYTADSPHTRST